MKLLKTAASLFLAASLVFAAGCGKNETTNANKKELTLGVQEGTKYSNDYFGFELNVPEEWYVATEEEKAAVLQTGQDIIAESNEEMAAQLDLAMEKTLGLIFTFKYPLTHQGINPNVLCTAENLGLLGAAAIKTGEDYLSATQTNMEQIDLPYTFGEISKETLGGKEFYTMESTLDYGSIVLGQKYYCLVIDGYALLFVSTYSNDAEAIETQALFDSILFK